MRNITVVIADDIKETRDNIKLLLSLDNHIKVVDEAEDGEDAIKKCKELTPDVILLDINMPRMDGIRAAKRISVEVPETLIIMTSVQGEIEYLKKSMSSGAKGYLVKPFTPDEIIQTIKETYELERAKKVKNNENEKEVRTKYVSVFSTKGGVGKTTIATNLAISLSRLTNDRILLIDMNLQFGDVSLFLNKIPQKTIVDMMEDVNELDTTLIEEYCITYTPGIDVLAAPKKPEEGEYVTTEFIKKILNIVNKHYDYVIIDTATGFNDITLTALDYSDMILYISALDLASIKNSKLGFEILNSLDYPNEKIKFIINKANDQYGIKYNDIAQTIDREVDIWVPEDTKSVIPSINKGTPLVLGRGNSKITKRIRDISSLVLDKESNKGFFKRVLGQA